VKLKGYGYLVSIVSVFLLAVPALKSAQESTLMAVCLVAGMIASIIGMGIRWLADLRQKAKIRQVRREAEGAPPNQAHPA
jgi:anaerobic C4-dicarboxylate transporter